MRWRRDVTAGARSDALLHPASDSEATNSGSPTHATTGPPTTTTVNVTSPAEPATTRLTGVRHRPLAVEPLGRRRLSSEMRRNPLKDVGEFLATTMEH